MHRFSFWSTCSFAMEKNKKKKGRRNIHLGWDRKKIRDERRKKEKKKKLVRVCFAHRTIFWFDVRSNVMFRPRCSLLFFYLSSLLSSRSVTFSRFLSFSFFSSIFLSSGMVVCRPPSAIHSHRHCRNCSTDWFRLCRLWNFRKITRRVASGVPTSAITDLLECW